MKILATLAFFDDDPAMLERAVKSAVASGADQILAVDGPYANFPHDRTRSPHECYDAIMTAAGSRTVFFQGPVVAWEGDETAKRRHMLEQALQLTDPGDWLMVSMGEKRPPLIQREE